MGYPLLLDASSSLHDALTSLFTNLFQLPVIITALALMLGFAVLGWLIAFIFLRPKKVCSMVCSIHFLLTIGAIVLGMIGAFGIIDHYQGSLITGAGVALLVLTIPLFILVESFNYVVLSNEHARRHRDLRTPQDKRVRRIVVFLTPLALGLILLGVGLLLSATVTSLTPLTAVVILLLILWVLALGAQLFMLARARRRRSRLAALGTGPMLDQEAVAALWVSGVSSYRIGRGETDVTHWEVFSERVFVTEELLLEEEGELDLVEVEEEETRVYAVAVAGGSGSQGMRSGPAPHQQHLLKRQKASSRFRRRWGGPILLLLITVAAVVVTVLAGSVAAATTAGIALAYLAPAVFLIAHRIHRDNEVRFATETADKISTVQAVAVGATATTFAASVTPIAPAPGTPAGRAQAGRAASGAQGPGAALHPARPQPVIPPATPPVIPPKEEPEPPTLPAVGAAGAAHENPDIADETVILGGAAAAGAAHENPDIAEETVIFSGAAAAAGAAHENPDIADETLLLAHKPQTPASSERISTSEFQRHLRGVHYPATRTQLLTQARRNNAPSVLILWLETLEVTVVFISLTEVMRSYTTYQREKGSAAAEPPTAAATAAPATPAPAEPRVSRSIRITDFQHYLHGVDYPATRAHLIEQARKNNAPPNMLKRLEELDENHSFINARDAMIGYAYHRYLIGATYPATRDQLLAHARANKAPAKLIIWLEGLSAATTFASLTEVVRSYSTHQKDEVDEVDENEEETTSVASSAESKGPGGIGFKEFTHFLRGIHYPATRDQLVEQARKNNAPPAMITRLEEEFPAHHEFKSMADVMRGYGHHLPPEEEAKQ